MALKKAQAEGDKLKVAAGLTPREKADFEMRTKIGVAEQLAKVNMPSIVVSGSDGANPMTSVGIKYLMDINDKLSRRSN